ncbi:MAG: TPR end-of-group domain-containing protein, partial [Chitinophagales bacterium]
VLSFTDLSSNRDQEYLSDGIADEIQNRLCKFKDLKVASLTSSFAFKGKKEDIKSIGQKLNVRNILEGSVSKVENQIRINIQLTNAATGFSLLSESYDGDLKNILSLRSDIAIKIAEKIKASLSSVENQLALNKREINPKAYEAYLKGRAQFVNGPFNPPSDLTKAKKYFETAVAEDRTFSEAYAFLALTYYNFADWGYSAAEEAKRKMALDSAELCAARAILLDSTNSAAHMAMGSVYFHRQKWIEAEREKRKAVELNPGGADEKTILASFLSTFGKEDEAIRLSEEATSLDTLDANNYLKYAIVLSRLRKFEDAIRQFNHSILINPISKLAYNQMGWCYWAEHRYNEAYASWAKSYELSGNKQDAKFLRNANGKSSIREVINYFLPSAKKITNNNFNIASMFALLEDKDSTFRYLNLAIENHESWVAFIRCSFSFDFIRSDPRFSVLNEKAGFNAYDEYNAVIKK